MAGACRARGGAPGGPRVDPGALPEQEPRTTSVPAGVRHQFAPPLADVGPILDPEPRSPRPRPTPGSPGSTALLTRTPTDRRAAWPLASILLLPACATYNERVAAPLDAFERGDFVSAEALFDAELSEGSPFLAGVEAGTSAFVAGDFEGALERLHAAEDAVRDVEERALIGGEGLSEDLLSLVVNEGQRAYAGEGYERVMLHALLGLCYLARGSADGVLVEARRVDRLLTAEEELYETEYAAGGLGHLLSAIAYELKDKPGEAFIDYRRMAEKGLGGDLVTSALRRLGERLGRSDELDLPPGGETPPRGWPSVVVVGGLGMGPAKREIRLDVPIDGGIFAWSVPDFDGGVPAAADLDLVLPGRDLRVRASLIEDVAAVASRNLEDRIAWLAVRSAVRGLIKRQAAEELRRDDDTAWLAVAMDVFTVASERADLRAWRTLPQRWVAARAFLPPGEPVALELAAGRALPVALGTFRLQPGETMFVLARALDSGLTAHVIGGERLLPPAPTTPEDFDPSRTVPDPPASNQP